MFKREGFGDTRYGARYNEIYGPLVEQGLSAAPETMTKAYLIRRILASASIPDEQKKIQISQWILKPVSETLSIESEEGEFKQALADASYLFAADIDKLMSKSGQQGIGAMQAREQRRLKNCKPLNMGLAAIEENTGLGFGFKSITKVVSKPMKAVKAPKVVKKAAKLAVKAHTAPIKATLKVAKPVGKTALKTGVKGAKFAKDNPELIVAGAALATGNPMLAAAIASRSKTAKKFLPGGAAAGAEAATAYEAGDYATAAQAAEAATEQAGGGEEAQIQQFAQSSQPSQFAPAVAPAPIQAQEEAEETEETAEAEGTAPAKKPTKKGGIMAWLKSLFIEEAPSGVSGLGWTKANIKNLSGLQAEGLKGVQWAGGKNLGDLLQDESPEPRLEGLNGLKPEGLGATAPAPAKKTKLKYANIGIAFALLAMLGLGVVYRKKLPFMKKNPYHRSYRRRHHSRRRK